MYLVKHHVGIEQILPEELRRPHFTGMLFSTSEKLSKALDCEFDSADPEPALKCLRSRSAEDIVRNQKVATEFPNLFPFSPTLDGTFLSASPKNLLLSGQVKDAPVLIGSNEEEGSW